MKHAILPKMNTRALTIVLLITAFLLSACGKRVEEEDVSSQSFYNSYGELVSGGDGTVPALGAANAQQQLVLRVISDVSRIETGGTDTATITALVTNDSNNTVADTEVSFRSTGGVLQNVSSTTDELGQATATLYLPQSFANEDILVTVVAGRYEGTVKVEASGSTLDVTGPENLMAGDTAQLVMRLTAGNGEPIANQAIGVTSVAGNSLTPAELITDHDGQVELSVGSENYSDTLHITALDGTVSASHDFYVVEDLLSFTNTSEGSELLVGSERLVTSNWTRLGQPVSGETVRFTITVGSIVAPSMIVTDAEGNASIRVSSNSAGPATLAVEAAAGGSPKTEIGVEFVATVPQTIELSTSDSLVDVSETSIVYALVADAMGNPVKNSEVIFSSPDLKGGQLSPMTSMTNSAGIASVTFIAGENPTETNEIQIQANVIDTDITDTLALSVFKRALNIIMGSGNEISIKPLGTQYAMPLLVQVNDGSGTPMEDATVRMSVRPLAYGKGQLELVNEAGLNLTESLAIGEEFDAKGWTYAEDVIECPAEDLDGDRILDTLGALSEDTNNNGVLDPQDPASLTAIAGDYATLSGGSLQTDVNGSGHFELLYPASNAAWAYVEITARAEALGVEATATYTTLLAMPASAIDDVDIPPANVVSPYGVDTSSALVRRVVLNNQSKSVFNGCTTTR